MSIPDSVILCCSILVSLLLIRLGYHFITMFAKIKSICKDSKVRLEIWLSLIGFIPGFVLSFMAFIGLAVNRFYESLFVDVFVKLFKFIFPNLPFYSNSYGWFVIIVSMAIIIISAYSYFIIYERYKVSEQQKEKKAWFSCFFSNSFLKILTNQQQYYCFLFNKQR